MRSPENNILKFQIGVFMNNLAPLYIIAMYTASHGEDPKSCKRRKKNCSSIPAIFLYTAMMNQSPELGREFWHPLTLQAEPTRDSSGESWIQVDFHEIRFFFCHDSFPAGSADSTVALWFIGSMFESGNSGITVSWTKFLSLHQQATKNQLSNATFMLHHCNLKIERTSLPLLF